MRWLILPLSVLITTCKPAPLPMPSPSTDEVEPDSNSSAPILYEPDYLMGLFDPASHGDFVMIDESHADRPGLYLRGEAYDAYKRMSAAAKAEGIELVIRSATRNHAYQRGIWERKWTGETILSDGTNAAKQITDDVDRSLKILQYSSMPGSSRHHWGTDIDLNAFSNSYFEHGEGQRIFAWLVAHAADYGYARPYTARGTDRPTGYLEEKWHWSYLPLSQDMIHAARETLVDTMISGFMGDHTADAVNIVDDYILGIHQSCTPWH